MKNENTKKWLKALRSGKYKQTQNKLRSVDNKFCCLGVLCDVYKKETGDGKWKERPFNSETVVGFGNKASEPPRKVLRWGGLNENMQESLIELNDSELRSFKYIAKYVDTEIKRNHK